jgi:hypothetical protein
MNNHSAILDGLDRHFGTLFTEDILRGESILSALNTVSNRHPTCGLRARVIDNLSDLLRDEITNCDSLVSAIGVDEKKMSILFCSYYQHLIRECATDTYCASAFAYLWNILASPDVGPHHLQVGLIPLVDQSA